MKYLFYLLLLCIGYNIQAQTLKEPTVRAVGELRDFIQIPNFGLNEDDIAKNMVWLKTALKKRNLAVQELATEGNPLLFAELQVDSTLPTVLFYMHLDGQAVDEAKWDQKSPYQAVIKRKNPKGDWTETNFSAKSKLDRSYRIFGRSAADDKGPIIAFLTAIDQLNKKQLAPKFNIKLILDAEEEIGSKSLPAAVGKYKDLLQADILIINDGPVHPSGKPTITFGCRGITTINMTTYGPILPQHSGHYGNYAPNPIFRMAQLLASMKDAEGRVIIEGYYDGIDLDKKTKKILAAVPDDQQAIINKLQIAVPEQVGTSYQEALQYPSLNARGINSAYVGARARTIVPNTATTAIDIRLVPESDPNRLVDLIKKHIEKQGYHIVDHEPTEMERKQHDKLLYFNHARNTLPFRTDMDIKEADWLTRAIQNTFNEDPVKIRIMGGTVPIAAFINELNIPAIIVPMVNPDNNQHAPNENLGLGYLEDAIDLFYGIFNTSM